MTVPSSPTPENNELLKRNAEFWGRIHQPVHRPLSRQKPLPWESEAPKGAITLGLDPAIGNREGYADRQS